MDIYSVLSLFGGLAFFLFGMGIMSSNLEELAGGSLESLLRKVTSSKLLSVLLGAGITIALQSSSAFIVMVVGLVNSGIIHFEQTIGLILGSNIGTTLTAWLMSLMGISSDGFSLLSLLSPKCLTPILGFIGIVLKMASKKDKQKSIGTILLGFSVLMYGMTIMSDSMSGLAELPQFNDILVMFSNPLLSVLISMLFTAVIQSSAATVGIVQALALTGSINMKMAIALVIGANIGTCITGLLSALGSKTDAKRVSIAQLFANCIPAVVIIIILMILGKLDFLTAIVSPISVAIIHTIFNVFCTLLVLPIDKPFIKIIKKIVKDNKEKEDNLLIDERLLATPAVALNEVMHVTCEMGYIAEESVLKALSLLNNYDEKIHAEIEAEESTLDIYQDKLSFFLAKLSTSISSDEGSNKISSMNQAVNHFERWGDHALNIRNFVDQLHEKGDCLSNEAYEEIKVVIAALSEILDMTVNCYVENDLDMAIRIEPLEETIDDLVGTVLDNHISRLSNGECSTEAGFILSDILGNCERISDYCSNIGLVVINSYVEGEFDPHEYITKIKHESKDFKEMFKEYKKKYSVKKSNKNPRLKEAATAIASKLLDR